MTSWTNPNLPLFRVTQTKTTIDKKRLLKWISKFKGVPILVVGDLMLDRTLRGSVERISPEAPVPVLRVSEEITAAGGAGNVVNNLAALGARPTLVAVRGNDEAGLRLVQNFRDKGLSIDGLFVDPDCPTITKTRVSAGQQQIVRVDSEKKDGISFAVFRQLLKSLPALFDRQKAVVISDYGKGLITARLIRSILKEAHRRHLSVIVDPKIEHFMRYKGVDCVTPNQKEAIDGMRALPPKTENGFLDLGWKILGRLRARSLLLTRGEKGLMIFEKSGRVRSIPALAREVFDVTGAGDTVVAGFSLARAVGASVVDAAHIANIAAGIVVGKLGTAVAHRDEIADAIRRSGSKGVRR